MEFFTEASAKTDKNFASIIFSYLKIFYIFDWVYSSKRKTVWSEEKQMFSTCKRSGTRLESAQGECLKRWLNKDYVYPRNEQDDTLYCCWVFSTKVSDFYWSRLLRNLVTFESAITENSEQCTQKILLLNLDANFELAESYERCRATCWLFLHMTWEVN